MSDRRQDGQVVDQEHPAVRGAVVQAAPDLGEVPLELGEPPAGRVRVAEVGDPRPDARQPRQWPGQACQGEAGQVADVVAAGGDGDQCRLRGDGVELAGVACAGGTQDVTGCRAGEGDVMQVERERPGDPVRVVARRPPGPARAARGAGRKARPGRERAAHGHVTAPGRNRHLVLPCLPAADDKQGVGDAEADEGDQHPSVRQGTRRRRCGRGPGVPGSVMGSAPGGRGE